MPIATAVLLVSIVIYWVHKILLSKLVLKGISVHMGPHLLLVLPFAPRVHTVPLAQRLPSHAQAAFISLQTVKQFARSVLSDSTVPMARSLEVFLEMAIS